MDKDVETGKWQCPVLNKPFTDHTKVVAVIQHPPSTEANVYSYEAIQELNIKPKNYTDLISGKKFHRVNDVIILQDPNDEEQQRLRDISNFVHTQTMRKQEETKNAAAAVDPNKLVSGDVRHSVTASRIMDQIKKKREQDELEDQKRKRKMAASTITSTNETKKPKIYTNELQGFGNMTSGQCSGSFTSTSMNISNTNAIREATQEEILQSLFYMMKRRKQKGFVHFITSLGDVDVEIHADIVPKTAMNFLGLVDQKAYDGCIFHRSIRNFMIQGGKPMEGKEECLWGGSFEDEFDDRLIHSGAGILSMANAGPSTNKRQFFITYKSAPHLDRKHSVFGRVIKGLDILKQMENIPTNHRDKPKQEIKIISAEILGPNPVTDAQEAETIRIQDKSEEIRNEKESRLASALGKSVSSVKTVKSNETFSSVTESGNSNCVGKYLPKSKLHNIDEEVSITTTTTTTTTTTKYAKDDEEVPTGEVRKKNKKKKSGVEKNLSNNNSHYPSRLPPPPKKTTFGDFSGW